MDAASVLVVVAAVGVNFGWQPDQRDPQAYEVVVHLEPQLVDALAEGHAVPIDAHIPPGVAPIRKVRVLVGTGDVPRTPLAASSPSRPRITAYPPRNDAAAAERQSTESQPTVVRGQDAGWADDRYNDVGTSNRRRYDQLGPTIGVEPIRTAQAPPPLDRVQSAAVETGNALRSGVEAGIQQANQQTGRTSGSSPSPPPVWAPPPLWEGSTATSSSPASSPAASTSTASAASTTAWTSIRPDLAPPRLPIPALTSTDLRVADSGSSRLGGGPNFPSTYDSRTPTRSVLVDSPNSGGPSTSARNAAAAPDWSDSWGSAPTTSQARTSQATSRSATAEDARWAWPEPNSSAAGSLTSSTPSSGSPAASTPAAVSDDRYSQPVVSLPSTSNPWADRDGSPATASTDSANSNTSPLPTNVISPPSQTVVAQPAGSPPNAPASAPDHQPTIRYAAPADSTAQAATPNSELPWMPLLGVSVGLAGSLAANLFLGMSYADARQKYRTLVRKTTHAFQKSAGVAA